MLTRTFSKSRIFFWKKVTSDKHRANRDHSWAAVFDYDSFSYLNFFWISDFGVRIDGRIALRLAQE
jgi:hypothetical protein